jgi:hypothetical protein
MQCRYQSSKGRYDCLLRVEIGDGRIETERIIRSSIPSRRKRVRSSKYPTTCAISRSC